MAKNWSVFREGISVMFRLAFGSVLVSVWFPFGFVSVMRWLGFGFFLMVVREKIRCDYPCGWPHLGRFSCCFRVGIFWAEGGLQRLKVDKVDGRGEGQSSPSSSSSVSPQSSRRRSSMVSCTLWLTSMSTDFILGTMYCA